MWRVRRWRQGREGTRHGSFSGQLPPTLISHLYSSHPETAKVLLLRKDISRVRVVYSDKLTVQSEIMKCQDVLEARVAAEMFRHQ